MKKVVMLMAALTLMAAMMAPRAQAQAWNSNSSSGLTKVSALLSGNTWTFDLVNSQSNLLAWSLEIFNAPSPTAWTAPTGWDWTGSGFAHYYVNPSQKYYSPPAIGPGRSGIFTLTFADATPAVNLEPLLGGDMGFLTHVGGVVIGSGTFDGLTAWTPDSTSGTWYDRATAVPEGKYDFVLLSLAGLTGLALLRRRSQLTA